MGEKEIKFIDLFGGIGGFRLGLEKSNLLHTRSNTTRKETSLYGNTTETKKRMYPSTNRIRKIFRCIWYCDINKQAVQTYNKNFKENHKPTDITTVETKDIPDFDMLCAGFPCQSFSIAGRRKGFQDIRGTMFFEIIRIAQEKKPKLLFLENVPGIFSIDNGRCYATILLYLAQLGYDVEWQVLNSQNFGVPQRRQRVFIIGHLGKGCTRQIFPLSKNHRENEEEVGIIRNQYDISGKGYNSQQDRVYSSEGVMCSLPNANPDNKLNIMVFNGGDAKLHYEDDICQCLEGGTSGGGGTSNRPIVFDSLHGFGHGWQGYHNNKAMKVGMLRRLMPIECERLQGFPDRWTSGLSDTWRYKLLGNAVTVNVIEAIGEKIRRVVS